MPPPCACFLLLLLVCFPVQSADGQSSSSSSLSLHFFMHDLVGTSNDTTVAVSNPPTGSATAFGLLRIIDDKLTEGPQLDSKQVGRAQGAYMGDSMTQISLLITFTAVFDNGTISFHGQDAVMDKTRELAVIGGSGAYRFSRGYATLTTHLLQGLYAVLDVNVYLKQ